MNETDWQLIETCPKGDTVLLAAYHDGALYWIASGQLLSGPHGVEGWCDFTDDYFPVMGHYVPTHWRHLLALPTP